MTQSEKNPPAKYMGSIPEQGRYPEKEMTTHSSILAWEIPWTEQPGDYSPWGRKEWNTTDLLTLSYLNK